MQFIRIYENSMSEALMQELRDWADRPPIDEGTLVSREASGINQFSNGKLGRDDSQKFLKFSNHVLMKKVHEELLPAMIDYVTEFSGASNSISYEVKLQKTPIQGGYSEWHSEQGPGEASTRVLSWMVYLNDVEDGGETEFLYQGVKQKAKKGVLLIWPASFTHTHRGNPPYSNEKYIVTGWTSFNYLLDV